MAGASDIRAGRAFVELGLQGFEAVKAKLSALGDALRAVGTGLALNFAVGKAMTWVQEFADSGREIFLMSRQLQMTTDEFQSMRTVAKQLGLETTDLSTAIQHSRRYLAELSRSGQQSNETMEKLGLTLNDLAGKSDLERIQMIGERLGQLGRDESALIGRQIFGRGGASIAGAAAAGEFGAAMDVAAVSRKRTDAEIKAAFQLSQAMLMYKKAKDGLFESIGDALAPVVKSVLDYVIPKLKEMRVWIDTNKSAFLRIAAVAAPIVAVGTAIGLVTTAMGVGGMVLGAFTTAFGGVVAILGLIVSKVGIVVALIAGLTYYVLSATGAIDRFRSAFSGVGQSINATMGGIADALQAGDLGLAWDVALAGMRVSWYRFNDVLTKSLGVDLITVFYGLRTAWAEMVAFVRTAWVTAAHAMRVTGENLGTSIANWWTRTVGRAMGMDASVINATISQNNGAQLRSDAAADAQLARDRDRIRDDRERELRAIANAQARRGDDALSAEIELENALEAADIARAQREAELNQSTSQINAGLEPITGGGARGAFNREAIAGLGGNPLQRLEERATDQVNELRALNQRVDRLQPRVA